MKHNDHAQPVPQNAANTVQIKTWLKFQQIKTWNASKKQTNLVLTN
jgi:hypothetical protein